MKRLSWKFVAGFVDGEGCIDLQFDKKKYIKPRLRIALAECGKEVLDILQNNFGGYISKRISNNPNWADAYSWELVNYRNVCPVLRNIVNHLIIKKEQARLILWMESNLKGKLSSEMTLECARKELSAMKRDPHRLSERAQDNILRSDSRIE